MDATYRDTEVIDGDQEQDGESERLPGWLIGCLAELLGNSRDRRAGAGTIAAMRRGYADLVLARAWITPEVARRAVVEALAGMTGDRAYVPSPGEFVAICEFAKRAIEVEAERAEERAALPAPQPVVVPPDALDEQDEWSCTPQERERWAREDQWCRAYAGTLSANPPPHANAAELDAWRRNWSVANWPKLTPRQRRAKERRIAGEREAALAFLATKFGRQAVRWAEGIPARPTPAQAAAQAAGEQTRRSLAKEQAIRELKQTPKGRKFLEPFTYDDLVQAELRQFRAGRDGVPPVVARPDEYEPMAADAGDDLGHVPDGDTAGAAAWLAELGRPEAETRSTGGTD